MKHSLQPNGPFALLTFDRQYWRSESLITTTLISNHDLTGIINTKATIQLVSGISVDLII